MDRGTRGAVRVARLREGATTQFLTNATTLVLRAIAVGVVVVALLGVLVNAFGALDDVISVLRGTSSVQAVLQEVSAEQIAGIFLVLGLLLGFALGDFYGSDRGRKSEGERHSSAEKGLTEQLGNVGRDLERLGSENKALATVAAQVPSLEREVSALTSKNNTYALNIGTVSRENSALSHAYSRIPGLEQEVTRLQEALAPAASLVLDPLDPQCVDPSSGSQVFAVRADKRGPGRMQGASCVIESLVVDGNIVRLGFPPALIVRGPGATHFEATLSPGAPTYFELLANSDHAGHRDAGLASFILRRERDAESRPVRQTIEATLQLRCDVEVPRRRLRFEVTTGNPRRVQFVDQEDIDTARQ